MTRRRVVGVFAHNEERHISRCLESVLSNMQPNDRCYVLINGCVDNTEEIVRGFESLDSRCLVKLIALPDKANAWNEFCHDSRIDADVWYFIDGDCTAEPGSFDIIEEQFQIFPELNAVAATPTAEFSTKLRSQMLNEGGLAGNLYGLSGSFVTRIRSQGIRIPIGFVGDDSLVGALAAWDLSPQNGWNATRIHTSERAQFSGAKPDLLSLDTYLTYYRRKVRYSRRSIENKMIADLVGKCDRLEFPSSTEELYKSSNYQPQLLVANLDAWFHFVAAFRIRSARADRVE